jgi:hypothetical protein
MNQVTWHVNARSQFVAAARSTVIRKELPVIRLQNVRIMSAHRNATNAVRLGIGVPTAHSSPAPHVASWVIQLLHALNHQCVIVAASLVIHRDSAKQSFLELLYESNVEILLASFVHFK